MLEGVGHRRALGHNAEQTVVRHDNQRVHMRLQTLDAGFRIAHALAAFKHERLGNHADGQNAHVARNLRDHGRRAGAGAAAHAAGHEHQIAAFDGVGDILAVLLSSLLTDVWIRARAESLCDLLADLNLFIGLAEGKRLLIGIHGDEFHALQAGIHHAVDRIGARAANTYDLNRSKIAVFVHFVCIHFKFNHKASPSSV